MEDAGPLREGAHRIGRRGELPSLTRRVESYLDRIKHGHPLKGGVPGRGAIELWSNDYLALSGHPAIVQAQVSALEGGGDDLFMSAVYLHERTPQRIIEQEMAAFLGAEDSVICQSGWCANVGLVQSIADPATPAYIDIHAHASLWEGAGSAGAAIRPFRHNDPESLEELVKIHGPGIVIVDAIYSANGSVCPLREFVEVSEQHGCVTVVDESHSIGVYGRNGQGLVSDLGLSERVQYRCFSLSKAFVIRAGMVAGPAKIMDYFRYQSRPAIFSSAVLPHEVAGLAATLAVIQEENWRRKQLRRNTTYLREHLCDLGFNVAPEGSQVVALEAGTEHQVIMLRDALEKRHVFGAVFCPPATPKKRSLVRLSVNSGLTEDDLVRIVDACGRAGSEIFAGVWPSPRGRKRKILRPAPAIGRLAPDPIAAAVSTPQSR